MNEIVLRRAKSTDLARVIQLAQASHGAPRWTIETWQRGFASATGERRIILIAESERHCVGFAVMGVAGDEAEIESIAVDSAMRRRGVGRALCERLVQLAAERGANRVLLEVRGSNREARSFYQSLGMREVGVRREYYRDPTEDALVLDRRLDPKM